jgi:hypothetical protein
VLSQKDELLLQQKIDNIILKVRKKENLFVYVVLSFRLI